MKQTNRSNTVWAYVTIFAIVLLFVGVITFSKAGDVKDDFRFHLYLSDKSYDNTITGLWSSMPYNYRPDLDYSDYSGVWIDLVDSNGEKVSLSERVLEMQLEGQFIPEFGEKEILTVLAEIPESVLRSKWTYTDPSDKTTERSFSVEELLGTDGTGFRDRTPLPITVTGRRDGILVTVTELSIDVGRIIAETGGDGTSVEPLHFTISENTTSGEEFFYKDTLFGVYEGIIPLSLPKYPRYSLQNVSELTSGSFLKSANEDNYDVCLEAQRRFLEKPYLKPSEGDMKEEGGRFTYVIRQNLHDIDSHDPNANSEGCVLSAVYITHPFRVAMSQLTGFYFWTAFFVVFADLCYYEYRRHLRKEIAKYERSRSAITRYAAHELKTPLAVIRSHAAALEEGDDDPVLKKANLDGIITQTDTAAGLVEDLLELSRLEASAKTPSPEIVDLNRLTHVLLQQIKPLTQNRSVTMDAPEGEALVFADLSMMRTVLMNFLTNAVRYSAERISVNIQSGKKTVRWSVINDGTTIPPEDIDHVWDAFYTADASHSKKHGGTGLGLTITGQLLDLHKAKYGCSSSQGETEFYFELPRCEDDVS